MSLDSSELRTVVRHGWIALGLATAAFAWLTIVGVNGAPDSYSYWAVDPSTPYAIRYGTIGAFPYSPIAVLVASTFHVVSYPVFYALWSLLLLGVVLWLAPPVLWVPGVLLSLLEIQGGNVDILIAAAVVIGLRYAPMMSFLVLTKITPGLAILWFAVRREWRPFALAVGTTATLVLVGVIVAPGLWRDWVAYLVSSAGIPLETPGPRLDVPLSARLVVAAGMILFAARTNRPWMLPLAVYLTLPVAWLMAVPAFVLGSLKLRAQGDDGAGRAAVASTAVDASTG